MTAQDLEIVFEPLPSGALKDFIERQLTYLSVARTGISDGQAVNYFLKNQRGEWLGGILGYVWGDWLQIRILWVSESRRNQGHGSRLLRAAEAFALEHGAKAATLETHTFQAPAFYPRHGYQEFGRLDDYPPGHAKLFFRKTLAS